MRKYLLIILTGLFVFNVNGQSSFTAVDSKLKLRKSHKLNELICTSSSLSGKFQLTRELTVLPQKNMVTIDNQTIQIILLKFDGYNKHTNGKNLNNQKQLLDAYSKYELKYFTNDLGVEVIKPNSQWVVTKSKGWYIWYFRVGNIPKRVENQTKIQLFASTVIGNKILTINAPILADTDFTKASLIVNEMMEKFVLTYQ